MEVTMRYSYLMFLHFTFVYLVVVGITLSIFT